MSHAIDIDSIPSSATSGGGTVTIIRWLGRAGPEIMHLCNEAKGSISEIRDVQLLFYLQLRP
jgi:hypothetical protein